MQNYRQLRLTFTSNVVSVSRCGDLAKAKLDYMAIERQPKHPMRSNSHISGQPSVARYRWRTSPSIDFTCTRAAVCQIMHAQTLHGPSTDPVMRLRSAVLRPAAQHYPSGVSGRTRCCIGPVSGGPVTAAMRRRRTDFGVRCTCSSMFSGDILW